MRGVTNTETAPHSDDSTSELFVPRNGQGSQKHELVLDSCRSQLPRGYWSLLRIRHGERKKWSSIAIIQPKTAERWDKAGVLIGESHGPRQEP